MRADHMDRCVTGQCRTGLCFVVDITNSGSRGHPIGCHACSQEATGQCSDGLGFVVYITNGNRRGHPVGCRTASKEVTCSI